MSLALIAVVLLAFRLGIRIYFMRTREDVFRGPHLHARIDALFEPYIGHQPTPELVAALQSQADKLFRDIVTGVRVDSE